VIEYKKLPSLSRLFRDITVTEKLDGTQSTIIFEPYDGEIPAEGGEYLLDGDGNVYEVGAQSKNRLLKPGKQTDNYGFADWVLRNRYNLFRILGPGRHSGEFWGYKIARNYDVSYRAFSLFNPAKLGDNDWWVGDVLVNSVPVLYEGPFDQAEIEYTAMKLRRDGSKAVTGFMKPEGVVVYHHHSGNSFKFTIDNNDKHKWQEIDTIMSDLEASDPSDLPF